METALSLVKETVLAPIEPSSGDEITVQRRPRGVQVVVRQKELAIGGKNYKVDPKQLIRMIRQVTQTIGEYKRVENPYSGYIIGSLRKARSDMVNDLEHHFHIFWELDEDSGRSVFFM